MTPIKEEFYELFEKTRRSCFFTCPKSGSTDNYFPFIFIMKLKYYIGMHKHSDEFTLILGEKLFDFYWFKQFGK
jgi:hypothetical protein